MPRLFTAIELPVALQRGLERLRAPLPGVKWVDAADLHVTLRFFGDIDNPTAREVQSELSRIDADCLTLSLGSIGTFGNLEPHTLWVGVEGGDALASLARANERAARLAGLKPETRPFHPHVTLARMRAPRDEALARYLSRHARFHSPPFTVGRFVLVSARPGVGGGPYVVEDAYPLRGGGAWLDDTDADHERW